MLKGVVRMRVFGGRKKPVKRRKWKKENFYGFYWMVESPRVSRGVIKKKKRRTEGEFARANGNTKRADMASFRLAFCLNWDSLSFLLL